MKNKVICFDDELLLVHLFQGKLRYNTEDDDHGIGQNCMEFIKECTSNLIKALNTWPKVDQAEMFYTSFIQ